jgi:hypothetical protein
MIEAIHADDEPQSDGKNAHRSRDHAPQPPIGPGGSGGSHRHCLPTNQGTDRRQRSGEERDRRLARSALPISLLSAPHWVNRANKGVTGRHRPLPTGRD